MAKRKKVIYLIGALKNWSIVALTNELEALGFEVFSEWLCAGPDADTWLLNYAKERGWSYKDALYSYAARQIFEFDKKHIDRSDLVIMVMPCGKSGHMELCYARGCGKPGYILFEDEPARMDVMYQFATNVFFTKVDLIHELRRYL